MNLNLKQDNQSKRFDKKVIKVIKRSGDVVPESDPLHDIDISEPSPKFKPSSTYNPEDGIKASHENTMIDDIKIYFNLYKEFILWLACLILATIGIIYALSPDSPTEQANKLKLEIDKVQGLYIKEAEEKVSVLSMRKEKIANELNLVTNDIIIYNECIALNTVGDLPVDCNDITLSLHQKLNWKVNSNGKAQELIELKSTSLEDRMAELLSRYPVVSGHLDTFIEMGKKYKIDPAVVIAIAKADSSLGNELATANNIGNVGNNDRGDRVAFETLEKGIEAIYKTLNNRYLGDIYNIGYLSEGGRKALGSKTSCSDKNEFCYATSTENWNNNVINTLRLLYNTPDIDESFEFRTN